MSNVKLAIRVRPFTDRELRADKERVQVVHVVDEETITITNIKVNASGAGDSRERVRTYRADYAFDSCCPVTNAVYASQDKIFNTLGHDVLSSLSSGRSACVLTYGQSATGKTYTMMGSDTQPGLAARLCCALAEQQGEITVSFLEIYNERVHDLLASEAPGAGACHSLPRRTGNARKDLRVREHPARGPYVQNLRRVAVHDSATLLSLVSQGARLRRTAATRRNSSSSRSHALLVLTTNNSVLYLADLAGSEKSSWEGCSGGRLKESASINKSLVALSNVISALVSGDGNRSRFVPYRDSALTWLLKDCFTGGAHMFIIATISPSVTCFGESASTLRWVARARQLPTPINKTGPTTFPKAFLQQQYDKLLTELSKHHIHYIPESGITYDAKHWDLNKGVNTESNSVQQKTDSIGNIMNLFASKAETSGSTPSSATSGSSEIINKMDNSKLTTAINEEVDKLFGPTLERTSSGSNLKVIAPLRHKRRQYKSQEVLPMDLVAQSNTNINMTKTEEQCNEDPEKNKTPPIPKILYDNQRAEIVASVTERLYSRLKKKEEAVMNKVESTVDKKIMEPLNELRICTNARQRLVELSHKAMKNKRRIGIPAFTQTRKIVIRVKDQGVDTQTDLESYVTQNNQRYIVHHDAITETAIMTPRSKEAAVGPKFGSLKLFDRATETEIKPPVLKNSSVMTDQTDTCDRFTQTQILPPPRKKRRHLHCSCSKIKRNVSFSGTADRNISPVININISQSYPDSSQSSDELQTEIANSPRDNKDELSNKLEMTPDLLTNHNNVENKINPDVSEDLSTFNNLELNQVSAEHILEELQKINEEFSDSEDCNLPRVTSSPITCKQNDFKNFILGRNTSVYPFNIVFSPARDNNKKVVKFDDETAQNSEVSTVNSWEWERKNISTNSNKYGSQDQENYFDTSEDNMNKLDLKERNSKSKNKGYTMIYKNKPCDKSKSKLYRKFLGLEQHNEMVKGCTTCLESNVEQSPDETDSEYRFKQYKKFFENQIKENDENNKYSYDYMERQLLNACDDLEKSVNEFEQKMTIKKIDKPNNRIKDRRQTPTEYLHHLVQLRREIINSELETDSSLDIINSKM